MRVFRRLDPRDREGIAQAVRELAEKIKTLFPIERVYLYGSVARDEIHEGSDVDLVIIGDFKGRFFERIGMILDLTDLPVESLAYTQEEFEALRAEDNPFILEVLQTGIEL